MFRLYWKIFIWFWLMLILTIIAVSWVSISITKKSLITTREKDLLQAFTLAAVTMLENGGEPALLQWSSQLKKSFNIQVFLVNAQTGELVGPGSGFGNSLPILTMKMPIAIIATTERTIVQMFDLSSFSSGEA